MDIAFYILNFIVGSMAPQINAIIFFLSLSFLGWVLWYIYRVPRNWGVWLDEKSCQSVYLLALPPLLGMSKSSDISLGMSRQWTIGLVMMGDGRSQDYLKHILGISFAYLGYILFISWAYLGHTLDILNISWVYLKYIFGIFSAHLRRILDIPWAYLNIFSAYLGHILGKAWAYLLNVLDISCPNVWHIMGIYWLTLAYLGH